MPQVVTSPPPKPRSQPRSSGSKYQGAAEPRGALPAQCPALVLAAANVHGAVHDDIELEAATGAELQHAHAALRAVGALDQLHAGHLIQPTDSLQQLLAREVSSKEMWHRCPPDEPHPSPLLPAHRQARIVG